MLLEHTELSIPEKQIVPLWAGNAPILKTQHLDSPSPKLNQDDLNRLLMEEETDNQSYIQNLPRVSSLFFFPAGIYMDWRLIIEQQQTIVGAKSSWFLYVRESSSAECLSPRQLRGTEIVLDILHLHWMWGTAEPEHTPSCEGKKKVSLRSDSTAHLQCKCTCRLSLQKEHSWVQVTDMIHRILYYTQGRHT